MQKPRHNFFSRSAGTANQDRDVCCGGPFQLHTDTSHRRSAPEDDIQWRQLRP